MKVPKQVKDSVKDSVGYSEAENAESFMVGASIAFSRSEAFFTKQIEALEYSLKNYINMYENVYNDMNLLTRIIQKYTPEQL